MLKDEELRVFLILLLVLGSLAVAVQAFAAFSELLLEAGAAALNAFALSVLAYFKGLPHQPVTDLAEVVFQHGADLGAISDALIRDLVLDHRD